MKRLLILLSIATVLRADPTATNEYAISSAGTEAVKAYRESKLLRLPPGVGDLQWRVVQGQLEFFDDKTDLWKKGDNSFLPEALEGDWEGFITGGGPAVGRDPFYVDFSIGEEFDFKAFNFVDSRIVEVGRKLLPAQGGTLMSELSVFSRGPDDQQATKIATFPFNEDLFPYRLARVFPLTNGLLGIEASMGHPDFHSLILFDLTKNQPVGYLPFSALQYLPDEKAFWVARPVTKGEQVSEPNAAEKARAEARIIPIWIDEKLNPELAETDLFSPVSNEDGTIQAPQSPATGSSADTPRIEAPPTGSPSVALPEQSQGMNWAWFIAGALLLIGVGWTLSKRSR